MTRSELETAVFLLLDHQISAEQFEVLEKHLSGSQEARREYQELVELHRLLIAEEGTTQVGTTGQSPIPMERVVRRQKRRMARVALGSGIAVVAAVMIAGVFVLLPEPPPPPFALIHESSLAQVSISHPMGEDGEELPREGTLKVGSRVELRRGSVELEFETGVNLVIRGPAQFVLKREDLVGLDFGTAWFQVPEKATGFSVETPEFLVTDLGTEFGVFSDPHEPDEVHVFEGKVEITDSRNKTPAITLKEKEARRTGPNRELIAIEVDAERFLTTLPSRSTLPPHLYWSFDREGLDATAVGGSHPDQGAIRMQPGPQGEGPGAAAGRVGRALSFDGKDDILHTDWRGIGGDRPRTVAFWLRMPPPGMVSTLINWGDVHQGTNRGWAIRSYEKTGKNGSRTIGVLLDLGPHSLLGLGPTHLGDGEWHHIVVRYNGEYDALGQPIIEFFIDGDLQRTRPRSAELNKFPVDTITDPSVGYPLYIMSSRTGTSAPLRGEIDELYIFDGEIPKRVIDELAHP